MKNLYWQLDKLGRTRLSQHYWLRQFLYSEIGIAFGIPNIPDNPALAIEAGTKLCTDILEPLTQRFGPLVIRSGFRSAKLNTFGAARGLHCASNQKNYAYHIWDHRDADGHMGAAACLVIPSVVDGTSGISEWRELATWIEDNLEFHRLTFFQKDVAFNIGWHEAPRRVIFSRLPYPHWVRRQPNLKTQRTLL